MIDIIIESENNNGANRGQYESWIADFFAKVQSLEDFQGVS